MKRVYDLLDSLGKQGREGEGLVFIRPPLKWKDYERFLFINGIL